MLSKLRVQSTAAKAEATTTVTNTYKQQLGSLTINKVLGERMNMLMKVDSRGYSTEKPEPNWISASVQVKPDVVKLEQELLNAIQVTNP